MTTEIKSNFDPIVRQLHDASAAIFLTAAAVDIAFIKDPYFITFAVIIAALNLFKASKEQRKNRQTTHK